MTSTRLAKLRIVKFSALALLISTSVGCNEPSLGPSWPLVTDCDLHQQACSSQSPDQRQQARLSLSPQPIPIARPIEASVLLEGFSDVAKLEIDIAGVNMYMGYNRVSLIADPQQPGRFKGPTMLAFCTNERMQWQVTLIVHNQAGDMTQIPFLLETKQR